MTSKIWQQILSWLNIVRTSKGWREEVEWATTHASSKILQAEVYKVTLAAIVYQIWQERNHKIFKDKKRSLEQITRQSI